MKESKILTFKSWENNLDKSVRAIGLVDENDYFGVAINCLRDTDIQGDPRKSSVCWASDYVYENEKGSLRYATNEEVQCYINNVTLNDSLFYYCGRKYEAKVIDKGFNNYSWFVSIEITKSPWYKRLINYFKH